MFERFTDDARAAVAGAHDEARALGHRRIGTEHLLLALAREEGTLVARLLAAAGVEASELRAAVIERAGRGHEDAAALATIGIDLDSVRRSIEASFGPGALERTRHGCIPFTPGVKKALELGLGDAQHLGDRSIESKYVLLGVARAEGPGRELLEARGLGYDRLRRLVVADLAA
jgi:ATP-dependent Clp protease ATP-binding subunit ClpA